MDPRHPEQAIARLKELIKQYDRVEKDMADATTSAALAQLEREGGLVIQEICLVAPRIHEAMMQTSRNRRSELVKEANLGIRTQYKQPFEPAKEESTPPNQAETVIVEPKPRKKKAKKAKK